jgi:hypothetical protein
MTEQSEPEREARITSGSPAAPQADISESPLPPLLPAYLQDEEELPPPKRPDKPLGLFGSITVQFMMLVGAIGLGFWLSQVIKGTSATVGLGSGVGLLTVGLVFGEIRAVMWLRLTGIAIRAFLIFFAIITVLVLCLAFAADLLGL